MLSERRLIYGGAMILAMLGLGVQIAYQDIFKKYAHSLKEGLTLLERVCFNLPT